MARTDLDNKWMRDALCRDMPISLFFHEDHANAAKEVCNVCPVRHLCWAYALLAREDGVWGGTTTKERQSMDWMAGPVSRCWDDMLEAYDATGLTTVMVQGMVTEAASDRQRARRPWRHVPE